MDDIWPPPELYQIGAIKGQEDTGTQVIEATEFKYELRSDLGFKKPDFKKPDFKKPDFRKPIFKKPDSKKPDSKKPDFKKPDFKKPY